MSAENNVIPVVVTEREGATRDTRAVTPHGLDDIRVIVQPMAVRVLVRVVRTYLQSVIGLLGVGAGRDGALWVGDFGRTLVRLDPASGDELARYDVSECASDAFFRLLAVDGDSVLVNCSVAASSRLLGANTSCSRPLPKSGRFTRSPGLVKISCSIRSRTWSSRPVPALRPRLSKW